MATDMNKIKAHPAFIAYHGSNVSANTDNRQADEKAEDKAEVKSDKKYSEGEAGKV